jgi:hypothetical protein
VILSLPGVGPLFGAEFLAATGGDMNWFETPDQLAGIAGLAPAPRDSGRVSGNHHRPNAMEDGYREADARSAEKLVDARPLHPRADMLVNNSFGGSGAPHDESQTRAPCPPPNNRGRLPVGGVCDDREASRL